jgi:sarcosine oxidase subunit gamma
MSLVALSRVAAARRFGLKGPRAAEALAQLGIPVPAQPNTWAPLRAETGDAVARLGTSEFFVEETGAAPSIAALEELLEAGFPGAYPVLREDLAFVIDGPDAAAVLAQVCNVDFRALDAARRPVVMTLMIGVGVLVLPQDTRAGRAYRIWCDPTFGTYLWTQIDAMTRTTAAGRTQ